MAKISTGPALWKKALEPQRAAAAADEAARDKVLRAFEKFLKYPEWEELLSQGEGYTIELYTTTESYGKEYLPAAYELTDRGLRKRIGYRVSFSSVTAEQLIDIVIERAGLARAKEMLPHIRSSLDRIAKEILAE